MKSLLLIKAPLDHKEALVDKWYMPLDLMTIADTAIKEGSKVKILDGTLLDIDTILSHISNDFDIVGISYTAFSAKLAGIIATRAKSAGCFVLFGGQAASGNPIALIQQSSVDAVVIGDGEPTIKEIIKIQSFKFNYLKNIPNLLIKKEDNSIYKTPIKQCDLFNSNYFKRNIADINPIDYFLEYPSSNTIEDIVCQRPANIYSRKGCPHNCSFCARIDKSGWRSKNVASVGEEIKYLINEYKVDYIIDTSDTWIEKKWIINYQNYFNKHLSHLNFKMHVFSDIRHITEETALLMKNVNIDQTLLGIESGSPRILKMNGKYYSKDRIMKSVDLLSKNNIGIYASFVIGLIGEDEESLEETYSLLQVLKDYPNVRSYCNIIIPLPNSPLWLPFINSQNKIPSWINNPFEYNLENLRVLFLKSQTKVSLSHLESFRDEVLNINKLEVLEYAR